ncbi:MAG: DUF3151 domain-containing protein [Acidimicrobiales bacterium]
MSDPVGLTTGPPESELGPDPEGAADALEVALSGPAGGRAEALASVARRFPAWPTVWGELGAAAEDSGAEVEAYAYFRVGYHRGLDALRKAGWRGSGYVRWSRQANRGFLRCVDGLRRCAQRIGETEEQERGAQFLRQLDPAWPPGDFTPSAAETR